VDDVGEVEFLGLLPSLQELTLRGNPVCETEPLLSATVAKLIPRLELLDDDGLRCKAASTAAEITAGPSVVQSQPAGGTASGCEESSGERQRREIRFVTEGIKWAEVPRVFDVAANGSATFGGGGRARPRPQTARASSPAGASASRLDRPCTAAAWLGCHATGNVPEEQQRPNSALRPGSANSQRLGSALRPSTAAWYSTPFAPPSTSSAASDLTMGGDVICGVGALRRHKLRRSGCNTPTASEARPFSSEAVTGLAAVVLQRRSSPPVRGSAESTLGADQVPGPGPGPVVHLA